MKHHHILVAIVICFVFCGSIYGDVSGPYFTCEVEQGVPPTLRFEGLAEPIGDIILHCGGGQPSSDGMVWLGGDTVVVMLSHKITNNASSDRRTDIFLIIDEPHSMQKPTVPLLVCGAPNSGDDGFGNCSTTILGTATYGGAAGHANVFQGRMLRNAVEFDGVPIARGLPLTLRITGIRVAPSQPEEDTEFPLGWISEGRNRIVAMPYVFGAMQGADSSPAVVEVGDALPAVSIAAGPPVSLNACSATNGGLYADPSVAPTATPLLTVTFTESYPGALRPKNYAGMLSNGPSLPAVFAQDVNQNVVGWPYYTETTFFNGLSDPVPQVGSGILPTPRFPPIHGMESAGLADHGSRIYVKLPTIPGNIKLFAATTIDMVADDGQAPQIIGKAKMVYTDENGATTSLPTANSSGLAPVQRVSSRNTPLLVYEVVWADPARVGHFTVSVIPAFPGGATDSELSLTAEAGLAPFSSIVAPDWGSSAPVPRFMATPMFSGTLGSLALCGRPNLRTSIGRTGAFRPGGTGTFQISVSNTAGDRATTGVVTLNAALTSGLTVSSISGQGWTCSASPTAVCSRSDSVSAGGSFPSITLVASVAAGAPATATLTATAGGGGETFTDDDTAVMTVDLVDIQAVTIGTTPAGFAYTVDEVTYNRTRTFQWAQGTTHNVGVLSPQARDGQTYLFDHWSDFQAGSHSIVVAPNVSAINAQMVRPEQTIQCVATPGLSPSVRSSGVAELIADLVLTCYGNSPTPGGSPVPAIDVSVTLDVPITSRSADGYGEPLLFMDEPHSPSHDFPLLVCGAGGSNDDGAGICPITGTGNGFLTYSGASGRPNAFQGRIVGWNRVLFKGIPFDPTFAEGMPWPRILRITNLRGDFRAVQPAKAPYLKQVFAQVGVAPGGLSVNGSTWNAAYVYADLATTVPAPATFRQCVAANPSIAVAPSQALESGGQNGAQFVLSIQEGDRALFKTKNIAISLANSTGAALYPADQNQNVPGAIYNTEAGFQNNAADPSPNPPGPYNTGGSIAATQQFPDIRGLRKAGVADQGTRVYLKFSPVPAGARLFVPTRVDLQAAGAATGRLLLTASDANGGGPFTPITGNASGLAPLAVNSGVAMAVYEVLYADPNTVESFNVPVALAYTVDGGWPSAGTVNVEWGLAPLTYEGSTTIPRFGVVAGRSAPAFTITACGSPNLVASVTPQSVFAQGDQSDRIVVAVKNEGASASTGATVDVALPAALTVVSAAGDGWNCMTSPLRCVSTTAIAPSGTSSGITVTVNVGASAESSAAVTATVAGGGQPGSTSRSTTVTIPIAGGASSSVIRVNAGGAAYTDGAGHVWSADNGYVSGSIYSTGSSIANTADGPLYQTERWNQGKLQYHFAVPNGTYAVNLKFAEIYFTSAGKRVFHIAINGQTVQSNFDIVAAAGVGYKAIDKAYSVVVTGGSLDIELTGVVDNPKISAIEVLGTGQSGGTVASPVLSVASGTYTSTQTVTISTTTTGAMIRYTTDGSTPTSSNGSVYGGAITIATTTTLKAMAYKSGWTDSGVASATYTISATPSGSTTIRVNAGGLSYTDGAGHVWSADTGYLAGNAYSTGAAIANTADASLYQTERWNPTKLEYRFTVGNGSYVVNLKFAELYFTSAGQRVFHIVINGQTVQSNFDVVATAPGGNRAIDKSYAVTVTDGVIDIQLVAVTENPKINAIEILPVSSGTGTGTVATPTFSVGGGSYASTQTVAISTATAGATIRYTTDGSTPSSTSGSVYSGAVTVAVTTTLKAIAFQSGWTDSAVASATYTIAPPSSTTGTTIRVNAGGPGYTDGSGHVWSADTGYLAGNTYSTGASIANTADAVLYQTERWNPTKLEYRFVVDNGSYTVNLKFAELYFTSAGQRVFDIVINGQTVQSNFDIVARAGGANRAVESLHTWVINDGVIDIQLIGVTENPKINAIEILPVSSGTGTVATPTFSVAGGTYASAQTVAISTATAGATIRYSTDGSTPSSTSGSVYNGAVTVAATATVKAIAYKSGWNDSSVMAATYTIAPPSSTTGTTIRVNAGGPSYTDGSGHVWSADTGFVAGNAYATGASIGNTSDATLYQTERWNPTKLEYRFTVDNGSYTVNLKFAELYFTSAGQRVFDIVINGQKVQSNFDVVAAAPGGNRAVDKSYAVTVTDGSIDIQLVAVTENPKINAIEILPVSSGPGTVAAPVFSVAGGSYTSTQTVAISTSTPGATIRYTMDGSTPTSSSGTVYGGAVTISSTKTLKAMAYKSGMSDSTVTSATYTISSAPSSGTTIRVNVGGPAYTDGAGHVWSADSGYVAGNAYASGAVIANTTDGVLYQTERWNPTKLQCRFTVANGSYVVNLKFAELYFTSAGKRVFNIVINGQTVQSGFDIVAAAGGGNRAIDRFYTVAVTDGTIDIQLTAVTENPKVNAIEIVPLP